MKRYPQGQADGYSNAPDEYHTRELLYHLGWNDYGFNYCKQVAHGEIYRGRAHLNFAWEVENVDPKKLYKSVALDILSEVDRLYDVNDLTDVVVMIYGMNTDHDKVSFIGNFYKEK
jgi:hypothetical protein